MANGAGQTVAGGSKPTPAEPDWQDFKSDEQGWEDFKPSQAGQQGSASPSLLDRVSQGVGHTFESVGLPHDLSDIPRWGKHLTGQDFPEGYKPTLKERILGQEGTGPHYPGKDVIDAHREAGKESMVGYLPGGAGAVAAAKSAREGRYEDVPGDVIGGVAELSPFAHPAAVERMNRAKGAVGEAMRTPEGNLKGVPKVTGRLAGAVAGYKAAPVVGAPPWIGGSVGAAAGDRLIDRMIPDRPPAKVDPFDTSRPDWTPKQDPYGDFPGASEPNSREFYEERGKEYESARKIDEKVKAGKVKEQKLKDKVAAKDKDKDKSADAGADTSASTGNAPQGKERLSDLMKRKVDDAESRYQASRA